MRLTGPLWRISGSVVSWALFCFCFTLLFLGAATVMGMGGFCASGGPYVIEDECPAAVVVTMPLSIFGGLAAVAVGLIFARGFGVPLISWAWPILFLGLGAAFVMSALTVPGAWSFWITGGLFVVMGGVPLWLELRTDPRGLFLGATTANDVAFTPSDNTRSSILVQQLRRRADGELTPNAGHWLTSLGLGAASIALGTWLGYQLFTSF